MTFVSDLEPQALWSHFDQILKIPRGSKKEDQIRAYVLSVAERAGLHHQVDPAGNVVVKKPGTPGHENAPATVLQSHLDMVEEKNSDVDHDFTKDPIQPRQEGEFLKATGTTLGSDNGIGVAAMLALMESEELAHGPLEFLFTVDEETGLTGAAGLEASLLAGSRLINLDSEEEGVLTVGCAGGADSHLRLPVTTEASPGGAAAVEVKLSGLKGGHSGVDIHLQRGNAVKLLARSLNAAATPGLRIASFRGGDKHNAIPRESFALVVVPAGAAESLQQALEAELSAIREELKPAEPDLAWRIAGGAVPERVWDADTTSRTLALLDALPHGVQSMSYDIPGLVETSTNLAAVVERDGEISILMSSRSSVASALRALRQRIRAAASLAGAAVEEGDGYPGWKPDLSSQLLAVVKELHQEVLGSEPEVGAIHAGLECGIIGEKKPGMDMISFGPTIQFPHSPDEQVRVPSVKDFYRLLTATLERLAA